MLNAELEPLRQQWARERNLRVHDVLAEDRARTLLDDLRQRPYELRAAEPGRFNFQYWELDVAPCAACDHPLCVFGRWWWQDGVARVSALTGLALAPPDDGHVVSTLYDKGCYLDPHSDAYERRRVAFVLGLSPTPIAPAIGGRLEFLAVDGDAVRVAESRAPGWNTLDLFDVSTHDRVHRVSLVTERCERRAISGWFWHAG